MHAPEVVKLQFDPHSSEIKDVFETRAAYILWCCIKYTHITAQYFNEQVLEIGTQLKTERPHDYSDFQKIVRDLSAVYGRATVFDTNMGHEDRVDHEFWGDIFRVIIGQRTFSYEIRLPEEKKELVTDGNT